jgi:hypothetical protein
MLERVVERVVESIIVGFLEEDPFSVLLIVLLDVGNNGNMGDLETKVGAGFLGEKGLYFWRRCGKRLETRET